MRLGRTLGFDRERDGEPYWPLLAESGKRLVVLSSRGDYGYQPGGRIGERNHMEPLVRTAFAYIGVSDVHEVAIEYDEFGGERLADSIRNAETAVDDLVSKLGAIT